MLWSEGFFGFYLFLGFLFFMEVVVLDEGFYFFGFQIFIILLTAIACIPYSSLY